MKLFDMDSWKVGIAAMANGALAWFQVGLPENEQVLHNWLLLLQIGVAAVTIAYIVVKIVSTVRDWRKKKD